jgi:hypothetical protein
MRGAVADAFFVPMEAHLMTTVPPATPSPPSAETPHTPDWAKLAEAMEHAANCLQAVTKQLKEVAPSIDQQKLMRTPAPNALQGNGMNQMSKAESDAFLDKYAGAWAGMGITLQQIREDQWR